MKKLFFFLSGLLFLVGLYSFLPFVKPELAVRLTAEDGLIQDIAPFFWLLAASAMFYTFFKSRSCDKLYFLKAKRNIFYLLLGLFFIVCAGEEISWGQRIFGWKTPDELKKDNAQGEINIHNLWIFQSYDKNLKAKVGASHWYTSARIFALIWLFYCVLIPVFNAVSLRIRTIFERFYFPVIPLWLGGLFLINQFIAALLEINLPYWNTSSPIIETKETNFAFLFFVVGVSLHFRNKNQSEGVKQ